MLHAFFEMLSPIAGAKEGHSAAVSKMFFSPFTLLVDPNGKPLIIVTRGEQVFFSVVLDEEVRLKNKKEVYYPH